MLRLYGREKDVLDSLEHGQVEGYNMGLKEKTVMDSVAIYLQSNQEHTLYQRFQ